MTFLFRLVIITSFLISFSSCSRYGCTDPNAANYIENATEDGTCDYPIRYISFYTSGGIGGEIHVELTTAQGDYDYYSYSNGANSTGTNFNYDPSDKFPSCRSSNIARFERNTNHMYNYDAFDQIGNVWSGTVSAGEGQCKLVELNRDSSTFGKVVFYTTTPSFQSSRLNVILNPSNTGNNNSTQYGFYKSEMHLSQFPNCENVVQNYINAKSGENVFRLIYNESKDVTITVKANDCVFYDVTSFIQ